MCVVIPFSDGDYSDCSTAASEWSTQKIGELDEQCTAYIRSVFPFTSSDGSPSAWLSPDEVVQFREKIMKHKLYVFLS